MQLIHDEIQRTQFPYPQEVGSVVLEALLRGTSDPSLQPYAVISQASFVVTRYIIHVTSAYGILLFDNFEAGCGRDIFERCAHRLGSDTF